MLFPVGTRFVPCFIRNRQSRAAISVRMEKRGTGSGIDIERRMRAPAFRRGPRRGEIRRERLAEPGDR